MDYGYDLVKQIDNFKEKANQLQSMLNKRQQEAMELNEIVERKKVESSNLDLVLQQKQSEIHELTETVKYQIREITKELYQKLDIIEDKIGSDDIIKKEIQSLKNDLKNTENIDLKLENIKEEINNNEHDEMVKFYSNVQILLSELEEKINKKDNDEKIKKKLRNQNIIVIFIGFINFLMLIINIAVSLGLIVL